MSFLAAVVLFPLLFWLLSAGCGLLLERVIGTRLPALLVLALSGIALGRSALRERWTGRPRHWWLGPAAMLATYLLVAAPEIVSLRLTFTGYLLDTTGAVQIAGAERLLHHAHDFSTGVPIYGTTLQAYFGNGYPSGGHSLLASVGWLSGQNLIWLYSLFQALDLSVLALVLSFLARRAGLRPGAAALAGTIASVPALLYAYALMGSIKEITALPVIMLMGALLVCAHELRRRVGIRAALPFGVAAAAALDAIGIAASPWVGLFGAGALLAAVPIRRKADLRPLLVGGAGLVVATGILGLPTLGPLQKTLTLAENVSGSDAAAASDPGNLLRPLKFIQTLGVWLGESHRVEPKYVNQTYILIGIVGVCIALGLVYLLRRRAWGLLTVALVSILAWAFLHRHGTTWTDAKLLVILSPMVVFLAMTGALGLAKSRPFEGLALCAALVVGVLASDGLLYHGTNLAPTARYEELASIGERFSHTGPTLAPDFDEYSIYLLRNMGVDIPGGAYSGDFTFVAGVGKDYGHSYDLDTIALPSVERFRTIVMRRSPAWSRPPGNFHLIWQGRYYQVWRRQGPSPLVHVPLGEPGWQPVAKPECASVQALARRARAAHASLQFSPRPPNLEVDLAKASVSANAGLTIDAEGRAAIGIGGPARVNAMVRASAAGTYALWLGGDVDRPLRVYIDGHLVGAPARQSGDDGTAIYVATLHLSAGPHTVTLLRGGGDLEPDDNGSTLIDGVVFEPSGASDAPVQQLAPSEWRTLCGRSLDWIEIA